MKIHENLRKSNRIIENPLEWWGKSIEIHFDLVVSTSRLRRILGNPWKSCKIQQNPGKPLKIVQKPTESLKNLWKSIKALIPKPCTGASHLYPDHVSPGHLHFPYSPEPSAPAKPSGGFCFAERFPGLVLKVLLVTISRAARVLKFLTKPYKIQQNLRKSMEILWKSDRILENPWKSCKIQ